MVEIGEMGKRKIAKERGQTEQPEQEEKIEEIEKAAILYSITVT
jgi:hypothetical protein